MNLLLLTDANTHPVIPLHDPRAQHVLTILKADLGSVIDVGCLNGPRGKATLTQIDNAALYFSVAWGNSTPELYPLTVLIGMPRPQTVRKILRELTAIGVKRMIFFCGDKSEVSYLNSALWKKHEYESYVLEGIVQAFSTRMPEILTRETIESVEPFVSSTVNRIALDNYEASTPLSKWSPKPEETILAIGSERGWSSSERDWLRAHQFALYHLGERVLRTETACVAGSALVLAAMNIF
jgi:RsmE family RNA methyltransferase